MTVGLVKKTNPNARTMIELTQPWGEYYANARAVGLALFDLGCRAGDVIAVLAETYAGVGKTRLALETIAALASEASEAAQGSEGQAPRGDSC